MSMGEIYNLEKIAENAAISISNINENLKNKTIEQVIEQTTSYINSSEKNNKKCDPYWIDMRDRVLKVILYYVLSVDEDFLKRANELLESNGENMILKLDSFYKELKLEEEKNQVICEQYRIFKSIPNKLALSIIYECKCILVGDK